MSVVWTPQYKVTWLQKTHANLEVTLQAAGDNSGGIIGPDFKIPAQAGDVIKLDDFVVYTTNDLATVSTAAGIWYDVTDFDLYPPTPASRPIAAAAWGTLTSLANHTSWFQGVDQTGTNNIYFLKRSFNLLTKLPLLLGRKQSPDTATSKGFFCVINPNTNLAGYYAHFRFSITRPIN